MMKRGRKRKPSGLQSMGAQIRHKNKQKYSNSNNNNNDTSQQTKFLDNSDSWYLNPRFNLKDALADINKRLIRQTSFWIRL